MKIKEAATIYLSHKNSITYEDYLALPDDGRRYEIINGELVMSPAPFSIHQIVGMNIKVELAIFNKKYQLGKVLDAPIDVVLGETIVVQPDIIFICNENMSILTEKNLSGAPDLIIEIISPSSAYSDLIEKKEIYEKYRVREYWLVDPKKQWVEVYQNVNQKFERVQRADREGSVQSQVLQGFKISLTAIFSE